MKKIRIYRSCISEQQCDKYRNASQSVQPLNKPICDELSVFEIISIGNEAMKKDGFILSEGIKNV